MWQFKIIMQQVLSRKSSILISKDIILSLKQQISGILTSWEDFLKPIAKNYILGNNFIENISDLSLLKKLAVFSVFHNLPYKVDISNCEYLEIFMKLQSRSMSTETIQVITNMFDVCI